MELNLKNKVALITGASKGIGEAIAIAFAAHGAEVVINSRKQEELDIVVEKIKATGGECTSIVGNTSDMAACKILIDKTVQIYGGLDILSTTQLPILSLARWFRRKNGPMTKSWMST